MKKYFTIGMAGHIDHGKTSLTKALTNYDTDRLKEEKERKISIELGFAPLLNNEEMHISVIDVPGHERFIKQMIAGVAGIDLVVLVVAADEGVMPQTREHLEILEFLGISHGIVALSKIDRVDEELQELAIADISAELVGTVFENAPVLPIDSLSGRGIEDLRKLLINHISSLETRNSSGAFRMPIDQVFTVKGQGTVVRGTVYDGTITEGADLAVQPKNLSTRVRQMQLFGIKSEAAVAGQRVAINLANISKTDIAKGDVLVNGALFSTTKAVDVSLKLIKEMHYTLKQRAEVKCYFGTTEVVGTIVFFDRNEVFDEEKEILCQLRLHEPVVIKRNDRFIIRRPSPAETIGGGWVLDPLGSKYKFGQQTIAYLLEKQNGTASERVLKLLSSVSCLTKEEILLRTSLTEEALSEVINSDAEIVAITANLYSCLSVIKRLRAQILASLTEFHAEAPMKVGIKKAELIQKLTKQYPIELIDFTLNWCKEEVVSRGEFLANAKFTPHIPKQWSKRIDQLLKRLQEAKFSVQYLSNYFDEVGIPVPLRKDFANFLVSNQQMIALDENFFVDKKTFDQAVQKLKLAVPEMLETKDAKEILGISRKYLIPFLETLDQLGITRRQENNIRKWI